MKFEKSNKPQLKAGNARKEDCQLVWANKNQVQWNDRHLLERCFLVCRLQMKVNTMAWSIYCISKYFNYSIYLMVIDYNLKLLLITGYSPSSVTIFLSSLFSLSLLYNFSSFIFYFARRPSTVEPCRMFLSIYIQKVIPLSITLTYVHKTLREKFWPISNPNICSSSSARFYKWFHADYCPTSSSWSLEITKSHGLCFAPIHH